jgi:hypothetical protein
MKNIKCLTCKFYYIRPSSQNYNFSLCTKYNTFSVISRQDPLLCGPTYKNYEKVTESKKVVTDNNVTANNVTDNNVTENNVTDNKKTDQYKMYAYDNSYDYIMSQIHI